LDGGTADRFLSNLIGGWAYEVDDLFKGKERRFHQGPRVTTLNFEAGYMHAVLTVPARRRVLAIEVGSIYAPKSACLPNRKTHE
jgi:hypothetical protein